MTKQFSMNPRRGYPGRLPYRAMKRSKTTLVARVPAGNLRVHLVLQKPVEVRSPSGTVTTTYQSVDDDVWGDTQPIQGIQLWYAQQFAPKADTLVTIRFRNDVRAGWQFLTDEGWQYVVRAVPTDVSGLGTLLNIHCQALQLGAI